MTAPVGTAPFTSKESSTSERNHTQWILDVITELGSDWSLRRGMTIEELIGKKPLYALKKDGTSQEWQCDGGYIFYKRKLKGVTENKWQRTRENVCERASRYLTFLKGSQIFISCSGPGFILKNGGGSTGPLLDMLMFSGVCVVENVNEEAEFKRIFKNWVTSLI